MVWGNDGEADYEPHVIWSAELPLLRNIYDYPDALLEMNNLFKRRLQQNMLIVSSEKGPTYEPRSKLQRQFGRLHVKWWCNH